MKIRGYRVELGEIEGALLKHELVKNAAVTVIEKGGNKYITAYYTGEAIPEDELKTFLEPLIPDYMMPSFFVSIEEMPVTPGGKIDKKSTANAGGNHEHCQLCRAGYCSSENTL